MLLQPKITKAVYPSGIVARTRLHAQLAHWQERRAIVVHAPSGYGKSTLISHWLDAAGLTRQAAWLSLDAGDRAPRQFVGDVAAALDTVIPGVAAAIRPILEDRQGDPARALHQLLGAVEAADAITAPAAQRLLVLDDVHRAQSPEIDGLLLTMLEYGPRNLHLILMGRGAPTLPLARLYAQGALTLLTIDDLRFTDAEVRALLLSMGFASPDAADVEELTRHCEGWVAALRLSVLASPRRDSVTALFTERTSGRDWISDYLVEEVLQRQTDDVREFLLQTSLLDAFNASLCVAVTGMDHAQEILAAITQGDLFVIPLERTGEWFRYHHLFQGLLQRRLHAHRDAHAVADLHRRAAAWLRKAGMVNEAAHHLLAAGDVDAAAMLVDAQARAVMLQDPYRAHQLLNLIPGAHAEQRPALALAHCRLAFLFDAVDMEQHVQRAEKALDSVSDVRTTMPAWWGEYLVLRTALAFFRGDVDDAMATAEEAQPYIALLDDFMAGSLHFLRMHLAFRKGRNAQAGKYGEMALTALTRAKFSAGVIALQRELAKWLMRSGDTPAANQRFRRLLQEQTYEGPMVTRELIITYLSAAENSFWQNRPAEAQSYQQEMLRLATQLQDDQLIYLAECMGRAYAAILDGSRFAWENPAARHADIPMIRVQRTRLLDLAVRTLVATNQAERAGKLALESGLLGDEMTPESPGNVLVPYCLAYIARGVDLDAITPLLSATLGSLVTNDNRFGQIHVLTLTAWQQLRLHEPEVARANLRQAVRLARQTGYVGIVQQIPDLRPLLEEMEGGTVVLDAPPADTNPLTEQELRVLALLAANLTYPQIGREMTISINTVRAHVRNLYRKLGVHRRAHAMEVAGARGLLPLTSTSRQAAKKAAQAG